MATRPHEREILRVVGGPPSILHRRNNVQWTEDGDDLPHFSRRLLHNRFSVYEQLHGNWIKSTDCESAGLPDDQNEVNCICQKIM